MMLNFMSALGDRIRIVDAVPSWQAAVQACGQMLVEGGIASSEYAEKMISVCQELGPYIAIAPGIAIPHARPEDGARSFGLAMLVVKQGVEFGSHNDPVYLVLSFATPDKKAHLEFLRQLATILQDAEGITGNVIDMSAPVDVQSYLKQVFTTQY